MAGDNWFFRAWGDASRPTLLILHGLFGSSRNWQMQAKALSQDFYVVCLDLPNHGQSMALQQATYPKMAQALYAWLEGRFKQPVFILGHSMGGKLAMQAVSDTPQCFAKLIVVDIAPVRYPPHHQAIFTALQKIDLFSLQSRKQADQILAQTLPQATIRNFLLHNLQHQNGQWQWRFHLQNLAANQQNISNPPQLNAAINIPALFIKGENSDYIQPQHYPVIRQYFPLAKLKIIARSSHWLHIEKAGVFQHMVRRFLLQ